MIRTTLTAIVSTAALIAVSEPMDPPVAHADTVKDALCVLQRLPPTNLPDEAVAALLPPPKNSAVTSPNCGATSPSTASAGLSSSPMPSEERPTSARTQSISNASSVRGTTR